MIKDITTNMCSGGSLIAFSVCSKVVPKSPNSSQVESFRTKDLSEVESLQKVNRVRPRMCPSKHE